MSKLILAIQSYPGANEAVARHWPHYLKAGADEIVGIGTDDGGCKWPDGVMNARIGMNRYILGDHLPKRLLNTLRFCIGASTAERICVIEYDVIFARPLPDFTGLCAHHTGGRAHNARVDKFCHSPWCFDRETAKRFVEVGSQLLLTEKITGENAESSPDVFLAWVAEKAGIEINHNAWVGWSRNTIETDAQALEAQAAIKLLGATAIHGVKSAHILDIVTR